MPDVIPCLAHWIFSSKVNLQAKGKFRLTLDNSSFSSQQLVLSYILYPWKCPDVHLPGTLAQFWPNKHFSQTQFANLTKCSWEGDMTKRAEKWPIIGWWWHHPRRFRYSYGQNWKKKTRPRCGLNRALKLTVTHTVQLSFCYCFYLYANVQLVKRDIVTAVIYCYITTDFHYAKRDSRLSANGGVMLQRVGIEKNVNSHFSLNF